VIRFGSGADEWDFIAGVLPNHGHNEVRELMTCTSSQVNRIEIRTEILLSSGDSDTSTLELKVKAR
jgi:hypothetical protein